MLRLSKVLLLTIVVVCMATSVFATTSRVQSLANTGNYINDDSNIFRWYGTLPSYTKMVMAEFGQVSGFGNVSASDQALGFTHNWGEDHFLGTWGVFLLNNNIEDGSFFLFNPLKTPGSASNIAGLSTPTTKFVLMWGKEVNGISIGILFTRSDGSFESTVAPGAKGELAFTTFGGGARFDLGDKAYGDAAITYGKAGKDTIAGGSPVVTGWDKSSALNIAARVFYELRDNVTVVPYFNFSTAEYSLAALAASTGDKDTDFVLGASLNMDVNSNNMLIFAAEFEKVSWEYSNPASSPADQFKIDVTHLPKFYMALESDINSWLTTRVGATKTMRKEETTTSGGDKVTTTDPVNEGGSPGDDFSWYLGAGFHLGDWDIDAVVESDVPFRLGYWLTGFGANDGSAPVSRISGTYRF